LAHPLLGCITLLTTVVPSDLVVPVQGEHLKQGDMMKKFTIASCALGVLASVAFGGTSTYSGKEMKQTAVSQAPCPTWYRDTEWDISLWGTYAFTGNNWVDDTYLGVDHAWGGGGDFKFFFMRYIGVGIEGYGLALNDERGVTFGRNNEDRGAAGAVLGTLTFRYPIACTRFAPYVFGGGGAIFGGGGRSEVFFNSNTEEFVVRNQGTETKGIGQFGGGMEVRFTPTIGWMSDFSWNVVDGNDNNFGMVRTGITFAF
jgi:hypothetical protein